MNEVWRPIKGFEFLYEVSNLGNVRHAVKIIPDTYLICKVIQPKEVKIADGDHKVRLEKSRAKGGIKTYHINKLVAEHFLEGPAKKYILHKDGNEYNNEVTNLEWSDTKPTYKKLSKPVIVHHSLGHYKKLAGIISVEEYNLY